MQNILIPFIFWFKLFAIDVCKTMILVSITYSQGKLIFEWKDYTFYMLPLFQNICNRFRDVIF